MTADGLSHELLASELIYAPIEESSEPEDDIGPKVAELVEALEENEDTLRVWTTFDK